MESRSCETFQNFIEKNSECFMKKFFQRAGGGNERKQITNKVKVNYGTTKLIQILSKPMIIVFQVQSPRFWPKRNSKMPNDRPNPPPIEQIKLLRGF